MSDDPIAILTSSRSSTPEPERPHLWPLILVALVLMAVAVGFFGSRNATSLPTATPVASGELQREARVYTVSYRFGVFSPTNLRIHAGDTVRFRNDAPLGIRVVAELKPGQRTPEFDSVGPIESGSYFSYTFATVGTFAYSNHSNSNESGVIIVR